MGRVAGESFGAPLPTALRRAPREDGDRDQEPEGDHHHTSRSRRAAALGETSKRFVTATNAIGNRFEPDPTGTVMIVMATAATERESP